MVRKRRDARLRRVDSVRTRRERGLTYDETHQVVALPGSPNGDVEAELVDGGYGTPEEVEGKLDGKVVLVRNDTPPGYDQWNQPGDTYTNAADAGAVGYVVRNTVEGCLPRVSAVDRPDRPATVPAVGVSKEFGDRLARYLGGEDLAVRLRVDCERGRAASVNAEGVVGPDTDREVLVTAHVDAHDVGEGAADNGLGSAMLPEIGRLLSRADALETKVRLVAFGSEETGHRGSTHWVETHDLENVKCVVNIDGIWGSQDPVVNRAIFESAAAPFERAADRLDVPVTVVENGPLADALPFAKRGVPAVLVGANSGESGGGWSHTHADTLDKLDARDVRALTVFLAQAVLELADDGTEIVRKEEGALTGS